MIDDRLHRWIGAATSAERLEAATAANIGVRHMCQMARWLKTGSRSFPVRTAKLLADAIQRINSRNPGSLPEVRIEHLARQCDCLLCVERRNAASASS